MRDLPIYSFADKTNIISFNISYIIDYARSSFGQFEVSRLMADVAGPYPPDMEKAQRELISVGVNGRSKHSV